MSWCIPIFLDARAYGILLPRSCRAFAGSKLQILLLSKIVNLRRKYMLGNDKISGTSFSACLFLS